MSSMKVLPVESECSRRCRSLQHGAALASTLSLRGVSAPVLIAYLKWLCANCGQVTDLYGRTALHLAASCGRREVARWLIKHGDANVNAKDVESGYTPLHRSIFYGQIHVAISLIQLGANVTALDHDDLTAIDHVMKDRLPFVEYNLSNPCEVYMWGTNSNYTLGTDNQHSRPNPELLESFRKQNISIKQVAMHKFHSVFMTHDGRVFSCGHGQGGRLGLDTEQAVLTPRQVKLGSGAPEVCVAASVGRDHTVLLMESGAVLTCGLNDHHQLGHSPPPKFLLSPRALNQRSIKSAGTILGVCAARFHTVIWGSKAVLTCGLHAGQLGYLRGPDATQIVPKLVSALSHLRDCQLSHVAASDGATVVVVKKGDIYVLHEYQCRKISSRQLDVVKVVVVGGHLDCKVNTSMLIDRGGEQLQVAILTSTGKILLWQESTQQLIRCVLNLNRPLMVTDIAMNRSYLLLVTQDGEAFQGEVKPRKIRKQQQEVGRAFHEFLDREDCELIKVKRLPHIHRAVKITSDLKGRNFGVIQTHPKAALLEIPQVETTDMRQQLGTFLQEAHVDDGIHDIVFQVGLRNFPAHRYIIASRSEPLAKLIYEQITNVEESVSTVKVNHIRAEIFEQVLEFIYTNDCTLLRPGGCSVKVGSMNGNELNNKASRDGNVFAEDSSKVSAFQVYSDGKKKPAVCCDPVKLTQEAARRFAVSALSKKLEGVRYEDGSIVAKGSGSHQPAKLSFGLKKHEDLYDVSVKSEEGRELKAHKCILAARLEYLNNMLNHGWLEASERSCLRLPVPYSVLELLVDFLYDDECPTIQASDDVDLVCNTLIVADELFVTRLKEICEVALAGLLTLRNVAQVLQFAHMYNANQLKQCCMQYVSLNLSALLESRTLEVVSETALEELSKYYHELNPNLCKRMITPYSDAPSQSLVEEVADSHPITWQDDDDADYIDIHSKKMLKPNKKKVRPRNKTNERCRNESVSSNISCNSDDADISKSFHSLSLEDLTEACCQDVTLTLNSLQESSPTATSPWIKISGSNKQLKAVQTRLRVISAVKESPDLIAAPTESFTRLIPRSQVSVSPPDLISDFPELQKSPPNHHDSFMQSKATHKVSDVKKPIKISQKQRKKMAAEMNLNAISDHLELLSQPRPAWRQPMETTNDCSLTDIMRAELQQSKPVAVQGRKQASVVASPGTVAESPSATNPWLKTQAASLGCSYQGAEGAVNFSDIIADEKKQKENWTKMRAKPLELTQLEDRAIEELLVFYNAAGATDEHITVHRVITDAVAAPTWITSHH